MSKLSEPNKLAHQPHTLWVVFDALIIVVKRKERSKEKRKGKWVGISSLQGVSI